MQVQNTHCHQTLHHPHGHRPHCHLHSNHDHHYDHNHDHHHQTDPGDNVTPMELEFKNLANVKAEPSRFVSANLQVLLDCDDDVDTTADAAGSVGENDDMTI